ncbi:MAG: glycosyltransferase [Myxococcaceae bacterium]|nr:glycosyltransferase [Myxococcaceae bacterium]
MEASARLLCVVVPCFDEEPAVEHTYGELKRALASLPDSLPDYRHLLYFVDDGSTDGTLAKLNELARLDRSVRVVALSRNFGHQIAITAGLDFADRRADVVLVMDADLENPPSLIPALLSELERGHDVALGVRQGERAVGWWKRVASRSFYRLFNLVSEVPIEAGAPEFFALSRRAREALARMPEQRRFLRGMVAWIGFSRATVPYIPPARVRGRSKYTFARMLRFASDALFAFSSVPVRLIVALGGLLLLAGSVALMAALFAWPWSGMLGPVLSIAGVALSLGGLQLAATGVVGAYVARSFEASRGRPLYLVKQSPEEGTEARLLEVHSLDAHARGARSASRN